MNFLEGFVFTNKLLLCEGKRKHINKEIHTYVKHIQLLKIAVLNIYKNRI